MWVLFYIFALGQNSTLEGLQLCLLLGFFNRTNFLGLNEDFFQNLESSFEVQRGRLTLSGNLCHNIFYLYNFLGHTGKAAPGTIVGPYRDPNNSLGLGLCWSLYKFHNCISLTSQIVRLTASGLSNFALHRWFFFLASS